MIAPITRGDALALTGCLHARQLAATSTLLRVRPAKSMPKRPASVAIQRVLKVVLGVLAVSGVAVGGVFAYQAATRPAEYTYRTAKVERGSVVARVTATGTLSAHKTVQVGSQVSGRVRDIFVDFNSIEDGLNCTLPP